MPDKIKLAVMEREGYRLQPTCASCHFSSFKKGKVWGDCTILTYNHEKHSPPPKMMPCHISMVCDHYVRTNRAVETGIQELGAYATLVPWNDK